MENLNDSEELGASFRQARKELWVMLGTWILFALWVTTYCGQNAFGTDRELHLVMGMPRWVFWGIAVPWLLANVVIYWFTMFFMKDTKLVEVEGEN